MFYKSSTMRRYFQAILFLCFGVSSTWASSHREAPLIANDPLADNTDLYAFRSPDDPNSVTIIANYIPGQLPHGGPNYYSFGTDVRYEIHIDNDASKPGDELIYRFTFQQVNEDPTTFFNIRLGKQNLKTTYKMERSLDGGMSFQTIITDGVVPPNNIGARSIESGVGLGSNYADLMKGAITDTGDGEKVFAGPVDDPFYVDLGAVFDLGDAPRQMGGARDGLACYNVHAIAIQVPIKLLLKEGAPAEPATILDPDYVIGVWASASRQKIRTLSKEGIKNEGDWVQVSRLGMPLTNEVVIPIGNKDFWNAITPYDEITETTLDQYFFNPELGLYMDDDQFGGAVPSLSALRIQKAALGAFDFSNGGDGLFGLKGSDAVKGTALDDAVFGSLLLPGPGMPRSVDLWPTFHTGVPNVIPYQLATGKEGNPLAQGKPFIHNFLPNGGDMLRLNMAVPVTPRNSAGFSSLGVVQAAVLGLTDPNYANTDIEFIPNMDGFPNGRRLEDDVTRIELQAVSGVVLAAVGLWYDDFVPGESPSPVTQDLLDVLTYSTGVENNDVAFSESFPYLAMPFSGTGDCSGQLVAPNDDKIDLALDVKVDNSTYTQYEEVAYTLTISNSGARDASGVTVSGALPAGMVFTSASASKGMYDLFNQVWKVGTLAAGEAVTLDLVLFTLVAGTDIPFFTQVVSASPIDVDSTPGNNMDGNPDEDDEAAVTISFASETNDRQIADVSISMDAPNSFELYDNITFAIEVTNESEDELEAVKVKAGMVEGLSFISATPTVGEYNLFLEQWIIPQLGPNETVRLMLTGFALKDSKAIKNTVEVINAKSTNHALSKEETIMPVDRQQREASVIIEAKTRSGQPSIDPNTTAVVERIFPVPALTTLNVELETGDVQLTTIAIYDLSGKRVLSQNVMLENGFNQVSLNVKNLAVGAYMVVIPLEGVGVVQEKFVKAAH